MTGVELHPHDPGWDDHFQTERDRIRDDADDGLLGVFHVGSTAVPGLVAKPAIDIVAVYRTSAAVHHAKESLLGRYERHRDDEEWVVLTRSVETHDFVLHLRPRDASPWQDQLVFRELLRENACARAKYEGAKQTAAAEHPDDVDAYTDAKEPVIRSLIDRAYEEGYDERLPSFASRE